MPITYVGNVNLQGTTTWNTLVPGFVQVGDLLVVEYAHRTTATGTVSDDSRAVGVPSGWTLKGSGTPGGATTTQQWYKRADAAMFLPSPQGGSAVRINGQGHVSSVAVVLSAYRGAVQHGDPFEAWLMEANGPGDEASATITTLHNGAWVGLLLGSWTPVYSNYRYSGSISIAERNQFVSAVGADSRIALAGMEWPTAGAFGTGVAWDMVGTGTAPSILYAITPDIPRVSYIAAATGSGTTSFTIATPFGIQEGDLMILELSHRGTANGSISDDSGDGVAWTYKGGGTQLSGDTASSRQWYKRATATFVAAQRTITASGFTTTSAGALTVYRGVIATGDPFEVWMAEQNASGNTDHAAITPLTKDSMVVLFNGTNAGVITNQGYFNGTVQVPFTERAQVVSGGLVSRVSHASSAWPTLVPTGNFVQWNQSGSAITTSIVYALKPAPAPAAAPAAKMAMVV